MAGSAFTKWWTLMKPYYTTVYQEVWVGLGITTYIFYKISYGNKKAVEAKPAH